MKIKTLLFTLSISSLAAIAASLPLPVDELEAKAEGFESVEAMHKYYASETIQLSVKNCEDYIYEYEESDDYPFDPDDPGCYNMTKQFEDYMKEKGVNVKVVYSTYDTNENLFNDLKTGKANYDIIMPSDYMIQKMINEGMLEKLNPEITMQNVEDYLSPYLEGVFNNIKAANGESISEYARPYMWGTVGIMYSPSYYAIKGMSEEKIYEDFQSYDVLYNPDYKSSISIKDSVRDLYAIGVVHIEEHKRQITELQEKLHSGEMDADTYNKTINEIFNRCDDDTLRAVQADLIEMKNNSFGFEVDSGKNDMVTGMIGGNIAWSGDAVYAIDTALEDYNVTLKFSIPTVNTASNIWFDGLCIPKWSNYQPNEHIEIAQEFIDFLYIPEKAAMNMDYIGYTPGAAGDDILNLVQSYYDVRYDEETGEIGDGSGLVEGEDYVLYDLSYFFEGTVEDESQTIIWADPESAEGALRAQYPAKEDLPYLAVMRDFGDRNLAVLDMWENVKTSPIPVWLTVILIAEVSVGVGLAIYFGVAKFTKKKLRKARRGETK